MEKTTTTEKPTIPIRRVYVVRPWSSTPPCFQNSQANFRIQANVLLGHKGLETYDWAKAARMQNLKTFWDRCQHVLHGPHFTWPEGVTYVNYPANDPNDDFHVYKP